MCRDTDLFVQLLKPHYNDALRYCRALCANRSADEAEDVLQQSFLQALENFEKLKDEDKFKSWFFKIITRVFYTSARRSFWKKFLPLDAPGIPDIPEVFDHNETGNKLLLNKVLSRLSAKERASLLLFEVAGFSIEEIKALQNERSLSAVKSRLSRARSKLKRYIEELEGEGKESFSYSKTNLMGDLQNETLKLAGQVKQDE